MKMSDAINKTAEEYPKSRLSGVDKYFNFEKGKNVIRIVSDYAIIGNHWIGKMPYTCYGMHRGCERCVEVEKQIAELNGRQDLNEKQRKEEYLKIPTVNVQYVCYVIDRADGEVKLAKLPYSVSKQLQAFEERPDEYPHTKAGVPIFDIEVEKKEEVGKRTEYTTVTIPSTIGKDLTEEEHEMLSSVELNPEKFVVAMKKKQMRDDGKDPDKANWETTTTKSGEEIPVIQQEKSEQEDDDRISVDDIPF